MAYTIKNFKTKKALKDAVAAGEEVRLQPTLFNRYTGNEEVLDVEGPHYPKPHTWYAAVELKEGRVVKVR